MRHRAKLIIETLEDRTLFAFGVTSTTGGSASYVIDNGGDLVFRVLRPGAATSSTIHLGDVTSIKYKGQELLAPYSTTSRYSHYEQGLGSTTTVTTTTGGAAGSRWILVTCADPGYVTQYYAVRENDDNLYLASLPVSVSDDGEGRFIAYLERSVFSNPEAPSDNAGNSGSIEGSDVFGHPDGTTTSKFYNVGGRRQVEHVYHGLTGIAAGGTPVGAWMFMGSREHSAGGPFFRDIDFQAGSAVEIYNCIFTGHTQTEPFREGLHVYAMQFTDGSLPTTPDYSWLESVKDAGGNLLISGLIPMAQRGTLTGVASGVPAGHEVTVGLSNTTAQYWTTPDAAGNYTIAGIQPGTYTQTLYDGELEVGQKTVTIMAGVTTNSNIIDSFYIPSNPIFRIGTWDGTPSGFMNADKIEIMHPSDVRMTSWTSTPNFVVGTNTDAQWPMVQFMGVNNSQRITFNLTSGQVQNLTLRIGITLGFEGGRNKITVNAGQTYAWTSANPNASNDLNSRGITRGTWRGRNQLYAYSIPASALRAGTNTIDVGVISGSYQAGQTWLSPNVVYDAIDLVPTGSASPAAISSVTIIPANSSVALNGTKTFTAVARDASDNVINANVDWSTSLGAVDPNGKYVAPATAGSGVITATASRTRTPCYSVSSSGSNSVSGSITGSGNTGIAVVDPATYAAPRAWWKLDETAGALVADSSGNGSNGTAVNSPAWTSGKIGNALTFDGVNDYVDLPNNLVNSSAGGVSMWVKTGTNFANAAQLFYASSSTAGNGGGAENELHVNFLGTEQIQFFIEGGSTDVNITSAASYADNSWHHVAATWDINGNAVLYVDGVQVGSAVHNANSFTGSAVTRLGRPAASTSYYSGMMDDVRLYNSAIPAAQVEAIYNEAVAPPPPPSVFNGTAQADNFYLRRSGANLEIWTTGTVGVGTPTYTVPYASTSSLTFNGLGGSDRLTVDASRGDPIPASGVSFDGGDGGDTLAVIGTAGADTFTFNTASVIVGLSTVTHAAVEQRLLSANGGGDSLAINAGSVTLAGPLMTNALTVAGSATLDIADKSVALRNAGPTTVQSWLASGSNHGSWLGAGITSSTAAADPAGRTAVGFASNAVLQRTTFGGITGLTGDELLLRFTYTGDADLSGEVTLDDFTLFLNGYQNIGAGTWLAGDFDFSGGVTLDDFALFLTGYQGQGPPLN